jgi:hypothetical protein
MLCHVTLVATDVSEALSSCETSVPTRATWCNIPEDATLHSHRCENLKSYINLYMFACICERTGLILTVVQLLDRAALLQLLHRTATTEERLDSWIGLQIMEQITRVRGYGGD